MEDRVAVFQNTLETLRKCFQNRTVAAPNEEFYYPSFVPKNVKRGDVHFWNGDTLEVASQFAYPRNRILVLNMANNFARGGGVENGCGAQEEDLYRRTSLAMNGVGPNPQTTPIHDPASFPRVLLSKNVLVFRAGRDRNYEYLANGFYVDVVSVAATNNPLLINGKLTKQEEDALYFKIASVLEVANEYDAVILGALGCGAFRNPPKHVSEIFLKAIQDFPTSAAISFAILDNARENNFQIFRDTFHMYE